MTDRPSLDDTLMDVARVWSRRSTCTRLQVGAVLARDGKTVSTGYNGAPMGEAPCSCDESAKCDRSVHAESNALVFAARHGVSTLGATMFCTASPCLGCAGLMINAGIREVVFAEPYRDSAGIERLESAGIEVRRLG